MAVVINIPCPCKEDPHAGWVVTIMALDIGWRCPQCLNGALEPTFRVTSAEAHFHRPPRSLRKIPPLSELEGKVSQEKLVEPLRAEAKRKHAEQDREKVLR